MNAGRHNRPTATALLLVFVCLLLAACGGASKKTVSTGANVRGHPVNAVKTPLTASAYRRAVARYAACMRANGIGEDLQAANRSVARLEAIAKSNPKFAKVDIDCYTVMRSSLPGAHLGYIPPGSLIEALNAGLTIYRIPSGSMEPTLRIGQHAYVQTASYHLQTGDIVIFHPPAGAVQEECGPKPHVVRLGGAACAQPVSEAANIRFIKRVVAGPGDQIYIKEGHVYLKVSGMSTFVREQDSYIRPCGTSPECNFPTPITVPPGHWFLMGDNRGESDDSRFWGPVPTGWIVGAVRWCSAIHTACAGDR